MIFILPHHVSAITSHWDICMLYYTMMKCVSCARYVYILHIHIFPSRPGSNLLPSRGEGDRRRKSRWTSIVFESLRMYNFRSMYTQPETITTKEMKRKKRNTLFASKGDPSRDCFPFFKCNGEEPKFVECTHAYVLSTYMPTLVSST